jgi:hypothetical protein
MVLLPAFTLLTLRHVRALASGDVRAWRWGMALVAIEVLWVQVHPGFVIALSTWGVVVLPTAVAAFKNRESPASRTVLMHLAIVAVALVLGAGTGAHGFAVVTQWRIHAAGDAVRHIGDMQAPPASFFDPRETSYGPLYVSLLVMGLAGMLAARRLWAQEGALALSGVVLVVTAVRGVGPAAVLTAPLATRGLDALIEHLVPPSSRRVVRWVGGALTLGLLALTVRRTHLEEGPLFTVGPRPGAMPHASARFLARTAPRGAPVLTSFLSGAPIGYWLAGNVRTLIDSRTPMHFSDADYGRARDLWRIPRALDLATARYGFVAAVADRDGPECALLAASARWRPVVVEASFTTFVRVDGPLGATTPLTRIAPCGASHLTPDACGVDRGASLAVELRRLRALGARQAAPFYDYLDALRVVRCGVEGVPVATLRALIPSRDDAWVFRTQRDRVMAAVLASTGDLDSALDLVGDAIRAGDLESLAVIIGPATHQRPQRLREILEALSRTLDDNTPGDVRAELAARCAAVGDAACVRFEGLRAAVLGSARAGPALCWLINRHPLAHVRRDAAGWLATLRREGSSDDPRLRCEAP